MAYDVTAFGEILIDFTYSGTDDRGVAIFAQNPGGAPGNVCVAISRLGGSSAFLGKVGDDMHGKLLIDTLAKEHVSTKGLLIDDSVFTTLAFVSVNDQGERSFSFARKPGADTCMKSEEIDKDEISDAKIFHIGSLSLTHEPSRSATHHAIAAAKEAGDFISYDPNYRDSLWPSEEAAVEQMRSIVPYADIMKISDEETALLTGLATPEDAAAALLDQGVKVVAVTLGAEGSLIANKEGMARIPGFSSVVADTNGAGDSFWGGMLYQISKSGKKPEELSLEELKNFTRFANAVAALTVTRHGAIPAMPTMEEVEGLLKTENEKI